METKIFAIFLCLLILFLVIELVRREKLTFKYAVGWIMVSLVAVFMAIFDSVLYKMAKWLGFQVASNFLFFVVLCSFVFLSLLLTLFLCQQNSHNDTTAQKIGMLEFELKQLKEKLGSSFQNRDPQDSQKPSK